MDKVKGCTSCEAGHFSTGGTVDSCTKCEADKYSASGATTCTDCPSAKGVASGEGKQESDCTWSKLCVQHQISGWSSYDFKVVIRFGSAAHVLIQILFTLTFMLRRALVSCDCFAYVCPNM